MTRRLVLAALLFAAFLAGCNKTATVTGTATYRERIALPPDAVVEVVLEDISLADAAAEVLARVVLERPGQPPFAFELNVDHGVLDESRRYAVRARITHGEQLLFVTDQVYPVLTGGYGTSADLLLVKVAGRMAILQRGIFQYYADAALLTDCATARRLPVAMEADYLALERAYLEARVEPGAQVLVTFEGRLAERPAMEGGGTREFVVVEHFHGIWPGETCGNPGVTEVLENTYWKLTRLNGVPVKTFADRREPHLVLRSTEKQLAGSGGCNRFHGGYELDGDALTFGPVVATMMSCPEGMDQEVALFQTLDRVRAWRIDGQHLEMVDENGKKLMRFEARAMP